MKWFLLALLPISALAAEPDWLLVAPQLVVAGQRFEVIVVAPAEEALPDEIMLRVKIDISELAIPAQAQGVAEGARRRYAATMPARAMAGAGASSSRSSTACSIPQPASAPSSRGWSVSISASRKPRCGISRRNRSRSTIRVTGRRSSGNGSARISAPGSMRCVWASSMNRTARPARSRARSTPFSCARSGAGARAAAA